MIYFIQDGKKGSIKIGYSKDKEGVKKRLTSLQTGNPKKLTIIKQFKGGLGLENKIHKKFEFLRLHGEWFSYHKELMNFKLSDLKESPPPQQMNERIIDGYLLFTLEDKIRKGDNICHLLNKDVQNI